MKIFNRVLNKRKRLQFLSALRHGGLFRVLSILWERFSQGYSTRSLTYSWPKKMNLEFIQSESVKHYLIPHLLPELSFAGLKSVLEFIGKDLETGKKVQIILHDYSGDLENFPKILGWTEDRWKEHKAKLSFLDASLEQIINLKVGVNDEFVASAWWTKASLDSCTPALDSNKVEYIIQDYEPLFYDAFDALEAQRVLMAKKTYQNIAKAKVNSTFLAEYLRKLNLIQEAEKSGKLEVFEPFIDPNIFCNDKNVIKKKQIFVYARPEVRRNRFDLCVGALNLALKKIPKDWEIIGLGTLKKDWPLKNGRKIRAGSKLEFHNYVKFLKETPLSLCLMESPHPSHPPLEHAASGGVVVCNRFSVKDYSKLGPQYICSDLDAKSLANALELAVLKLDENLCFTA
jgi:hypothetical protein